jgi:Ca2+/Na+ antiporter
MKLKVCRFVGKIRFLIFLILSFRTDMLGGYLCFVISIVCIGCVTAVIGDVASHFGCTLGIKDSVTAIVFVALGTSIPGE